ncbi:MFS general substrate transporter [Exidia glandulosa HHB12029]|uniref:MFS general substrate transporter n=1 Tax=Exidia glandulosa HHB12029 TaxID=1314781 RepID=A0A165NWW3_EXIGL|nr:MFS general substrate transporter [Exidia glandulosa HHB12029]
MPTETETGSDLESALHDLPPNAHHDTTPSHDGDETKETTPVPERYSVWSFHEKLCIITLTGAASMLSSMSANVYFPALPSIADDLGVSIAKINLTITSYLVLQGLSPMFFGPLADYKGRRLAYACCLAISAGACTGMALLPNGAYWLLVLLRCLQSAGSASTISIGYGTITDIATPGERGTLIGLMSLGPMAGPCIGPIIGGALADAFGWRGIFWFMASFSAAVCVAILLFLPETLRAIVHDGSLRPAWHLRPVFPLLTHYPSTSLSPSPSNLPKPKRRNPTFLKQKDTLILLTSNACGFGLFQALMSSLSPVLEEAYSFLTQTTIGLCFLAVGSGAMLGSFITGRIADSEFRRQGGTKGSLTPPSFPIEKARLRLLPVYVCGAAVGAVGYGWSVGRTGLSVPLVFNFVFGWSAIAMMNSHQVLLMDLAPGQGASVTAANNMFRCLLSACIVAFQDPLRSAVGVGWLFVLFAGTMVMIVAPLIFVERRFGPGWRRKRAEKALGEVKT